MLRTIIIGSCVSVQGAFVRQLQNGQVVVRVGETEFVGRPISILNRRSEARKACTSACQGA